MDWRAAAASKVFDALMRPGGDNFVRSLAMKSFHLAQTEAKRAIFQRAVPVAVIHIDFADFDAMLPGVANDLRWCVETHRL